MGAEHRSHKFINSWTQLSMAAEIVLHALLLVALIALLLFAPPFVTMFSKYSAEDHQAIAKELFYLNYTKWPLFIALAVYVGLVSILFSHRIVGPAYRLRKTIEQMTDRNLEVQLKLRKADYLTEVQDSLRALNSKLKNDIQIVAQENQKARNALNGDRKDLEQALESIDRIVKGYRGLE